MRKKILRSKSGFEKPESREEAIMQNILGASNVLEPSESNIEEILKSILYNTPYIKEAESEIEKILLAIKNNGTYDGEGESRDMKILIAILRNLNYTEEAESRIEELFIEWLYQRSQIKVLEGVPPLTFTSQGLPLINYLIEGNTVQNGTPSPSNPVEANGVGVRTENLFDNANLITGTFFNNGIINYAPIDIRPRNVIYVPVQGGKTYTFSINNFVSGTNFQSVCSIDKPAINTTYRINDQTTFVTHGAVTTFIRTMPQEANWWAIQIMSLDNLDNEIMINEGSTALPYEPYGHKIPVNCGGITTDIYIGDSPLYDGDTISMADAGVEIPTVYGNNVLTVDTTVQPSNVYIEYK